MELDELIDLQIELSELLEAGELSQEEYEFQNQELENSISDLIESDIVQVNENGPLEIEVNKYKKRESDGNEFVRLMGARLNLTPADIMDESTKDIIDKILSPVRECLVSGYWKSASRRLSEVDPSHIGHDLHSELTTYINDYINIMY